LRLAEARQRIEQHKDLNAFISLTDEEGEGTVVAVKDLVDVRGTVTTAGGTLLPDKPAEDDAPVIKLMRKQGCVMVGKANLHEWAFGVTSSNPHYGFVRNPHDPSRVPGGSSGGSAVAVAAGMCDWAVGSDTGGSIRVPASLCGVVGFKPTLGTVSTEKVFPLSPTLDTMGPLAPDVETAARALESMCELNDLLPKARHNLDRYNLAVPAGWVEGLDAPTAEAWNRVSAGLPEIPFPDRRDTSEPGRVILFVEAAALHRGWIKQFPEKYGEDVRGHLINGLEVPGVDYVDALRERRRLRVELEAAMADYDAVLLPATAIVAPLIGQPDVREPLTRFTRPLNTTGHPAITLPAPVTGLPVGIQIVGHLNQEAHLVEVALALETAWRETPSRLGGEVSARHTDGGA
jgi:aspartyl-tRNA(Asn)/glutamyl-tRNA(Gln) amidotransferase subunit A